MTNEKWQWHFSQENDVRYVYHRKRGVCTHFTLKYVCKIQQIIVIVVIIIISSSSSSSSMVVRIAIINV
jgi:hypothetical protein